ncbi:MAG: hypothetical protein HKO69_06065, partial [Woeseiaceae bacterium]|nr:hypothetical protein [Woeseiaceae bacterium]
MFGSPRFVTLTLFLFLISLAGCGGGSSAPAPDPAPPPIEEAKLKLSTLDGTAIKAPLDGAEIRLFSFDDSGQEVELVAHDAPVLTSSDGSFKVSLKVSSVSSVSGPIVVTTTGGTMLGEPAPQLSGVFADSSRLSQAGRTGVINLSVANSVVAGLLRAQAASSGAAPTTAEADAIIDKVEWALGVGMADDPRDHDKPLYLFNLSIDANLNLESMPQNAPAVDDLIAYLTLNLRSASGRLDATMAEPGNVSNQGFAATFNGVGSGALANLVP